MKFKTPVKVLGCRQCSWVVKSTQNRTLSMTIYFNTWQAAVRSSLKIVHFLLHILVYTTNTAIYLHSLSLLHETVIPPFLDAVDQALSYLDPAVGILGVADFYTSFKYDTTERQHGYLTRWFWRSIFDLDGIDLGPERRHYLDHMCEKGVCFFFSYYAQCRLGPIVFDILVTVYNLLANSRAHLNLNAICVQVHACCDARHTV